MECASGEGLGEIECGLCGASERETAAVILVKYYYKQPQHGVRPTWRTF